MSDPREVSSDQASIKSPQISPRLVGQVGAALVAVVVIVLLLSGSHQTKSVSEVVGEIHEIALAQPQGGLIGPWWVSAAELDPLTGTLSFFKVEGGSLHIAARTARVVVDPQADTFQIEMWDVVVTGVGEPVAEGGSHELIDLPHYVLGPIPYGVDIVPDRGLKLPTLPAENPRSQESGVGSQQSPES